MGMRQCTISLIALAVVLVAWQPAPASAWTVQDFIQRLSSKYVNPYAGSGRANWYPKFNSTYAPGGKTSWSSVVSACKAAVNLEKRLGNFFIRSSFHDSLAVNLTACLDGNTLQCGGADSSLFLSIEEMTRPENAYDNFSAISARVLKKIASFYNISVADTMAVCAASSIELLSGGRVKVIGKGGYKDFQVGRLDSSTPSPPGSLPAASANITDFTGWFTARGFTVEEAVALLGSHSLIDEQACFKGPTPSDYCDPANKTCAVRMFRWANHYYHDVCTPSIRIKKEAPLAFPDVMIAKMNEPEFAAALRKETCKFTSDALQLMVNGQMEMIRAGLLVEAVDPKPALDISWSNKNCRQGAAWGASPSSCPHPMTWFYTINDAFLGQACQGQQGTSSSALAVQAAMRKFLNQGSWDFVLVPAFMKMVTKFAIFPSSGSTTLKINGKECPPGMVVDQVCNTTTYGGKVFGTAGTLCSGCTLGTIPCHPCCRCKDAFNAPGMYALVTDALLSAPPPPPPAPPIDLVVTPTETGTVITNTEININPTGATWADVPPSPYVDINTVCSNTAASVLVQGFPSSPFRPKVFGNKFQNPPRAQVGSKFCLNTTTCMWSYNVNVMEIMKDLNAGCPAMKPTALLSYNGSIPGPTFEVPVGTQSLVRFNNKISTTSTNFPPFSPCSNTGKGRPISIHHHGSASLAPYDGWAEDTTCSGESKDYVYPGNRAGTGWYHDHQLEITAENAHAGLAGFFLTKYDSVNLKTAKDRWGLDNMTEYNLMLADKVMDSNCQLFIDPEGVHENAHFGDINFVSGVPFPVLDAEPKWVRFRLVNAAVSRPYLLQVVDTIGAKVGPKLCYVIAGDGGYRKAPVAFPTSGLFITVAERYEVVCDLRGVAGKTLYLWNVKDQARMKDVPFFCNSHLVMKIIVAQSCLTCNTLTPVFQLPTSPTLTPLDSVLNQTEYDNALALANSGFCTRSFKFGRSGGQWVVNGETWHSNRLAAKVGVNSHEIWCLETGGGWYHSIHIHLVDFYVLRRWPSGDYQTLEQFESQVPKDVVALHAGGKVSLLVRWGPHRGEYMFHCHLLRHEDNEMLRSFSTNHSHAIANPQTPRFVTLSSLAFQGSQGLMYDNYASPTYPKTSARNSLYAPPLDSTYLNNTMSMQLYRIFYPFKLPPYNTSDGSQLCDPTINPWLARPC